MVEGERAYSVRLVCFSSPPPLSTNYKQTSSTATASAAPISLQPSVPLDQRKALADYYSAEEQVRVPSLLCEGTGA